MNKKVEQESLNYGELSFKQKSGILVSDMKNEFINEELLTIPLYKKIQINNQLPNYKFFPYNDVRVECYCNICKQKRIFCFENSEHAYIAFGMNCKQGIVKDELQKIDFFTLRAQADCQHKMLIIFYKLNDETLMKIGQMPSVYDLNEEINNKKFLKLLDEEYSIYYKNACSLYSYNNCIGALTYLRRIFEKLLIDTFTENSKNIKKDINNFKKLRMDEKIKELKEYLPSIIYENGFNKIYTKISDGIHNLTEDECKDIFPILKSAIEEILIEKIELQEKLSRRRCLSSQLNNLV